MKYSKANLAVAAAASNDKRLPALNRVQFENDGTTVASNGKSLLAVGPPEPDRASRFPKLESDEASPGPDGVGISPAYVSSVARMIPQGRTILQYVQMTRCNDSEVELMATNGHEKNKRAAIPARGKFPPWRKALGKAARKACRGRVCVDRQALVRLLQALDKACPDRGNNNPVFIEFGGPDDALIVRSENTDLAQRAMGMVTPLDTHGYWLEEDEWEKEIRSAGEKSVVPKKIPKKLPRKKGGA